MTKPAAQEPAQNTNKQSLVSSAEKADSAGGESGGAVAGSDAGSRLADGVVEGVVEIAVGLIAVNPDQPRRHFDAEALSELAASIGEHGLMQPVVVRKVGTRGAQVEGAEYELVAGERRWRASQIAGKDTIRAIVREVDDETSAQLALIENVQREDLNVIELAEGYRVLSDRYSMTQERISKTVGVNTPEDRAMSVLRDLEKRVGEELGTRVKIRTDKSRTRGRVMIEFFDLDQFDGLMGRLGVKVEG